MIGGARRVVMTVVLAGASAGCPRAPSIDRIVIITLDTTRADHLGCYGYAAAATPSLDGLAAEGTLFEQANTPVPVTLPAHASLFTGQVPPQHGVRYNGTFRLEASARTLAEILHEKGWATAAIPASFAVAKRFGLDQGFDEYDDLFEGDRAKSLSPTAERRADDVTRKGLAWLDRTGTSPRLLWLHYYDPHYRYEPPFPYSQTFHDRPYDGEIAFMDHEIGRILERLRSDPAAWRRTLVVVAGDHGEGLYDHGEKTHGTLVYQATLHVPLLLKLPGTGAGLRVREPVSLVDVLPTLLDYVGLPAEQGLAGRSLRALAEHAGSDPHEVYFESLAGALNFGWSTLEGVRRGSWKLIAGVDPELFDLASDPGESRNLLATEATRGKEMQAEVDELSAGWKAKSGASEAAVQLDPEAAERLASLGYIGVSGGSARREGADPKRLIGLEPELLAMQDAVTSRRWTDVEARCTYLLQRDPANRLALFYLARAQLELGHAAQAVTTAEALAHRYPDFEGGHDLLGILLRASGPSDRVVAAYEAGTTLLPESILLRFRLSLALFETKQLRKACEVAESGLEKWPESREFLLLRARCEASEGNAERAVTTLQQVLRAGLDPDPYVREAPEFGVVRKSPSYLKMRAESPDSGKSGVVRK